MAWGNWVASLAHSPATASSWMTAGMPRRVSSVSQRWIPLAKLAVSYGPRADSALMRVTWPVPLPSRSAMRALDSSPPSTRRENQAAPSCAQRSSRSMRPTRSSTRSSTGSDASR